VAAMPKRARVTVDWLGKGQETDDITLIRQIVRDVSAEDTVLDKALLESDSGTCDVPESPLPQGRIDAALGLSEAIEEIGVWERPIAVTGASLRDQIVSIIPDNVEEGMRESLVYTLSRVMVGEWPRFIEWQPYLSGIDSASAALLTVHCIGRALKIRPDWMKVLWRMSIEKLKSELLASLLSSLAVNRRVSSIMGLLELARETLREKIPRDLLLTNRTIDGWMAMLLPESKDEADLDTINELRNRIGAELLSLRTRETLWGVLTLRPDGPAASQIEPMLNRLREKINALDYRPTTSVCTYLADCQIPGKPTAREISEATGLSGWNAHLALALLETLLTERYIPSVSLLGLRYRFVISTRERGAPKSRGLAVKYLLRDTRFQSASLHVEPVDSQGPNVAALPASIFDVVVDSELVSMRLDLYDTMRSVWKEPWYEPKIPPRLSPHCLMRSSVSASGKTLTPSPRDLQALGVLWAFRGMRPARSWLLSSIRFSRSTLRHVIPRVLESGLLTLLYHPTLEYCALPEGLLVAARKMTSRKADSLATWITRAFPYCRLLTSRPAGQAAAVVRVPALKSDTAKAIIEEKLQEMDCEYVVAGIESCRSYYMTALNRIHDSHARTWVDPWQ